MGGEGLGERGKLRGLPAPRVALDTTRFTIRTLHLRPVGTTVLARRPSLGPLNDNTSLASALASAEIGKYRKIQRLSGLPGEFGLIDSLSAGVFEELAVRLDNKPGIALRD